MARWMGFSLLAAALWGILALLLKLATLKMSNTAAKLWETIALSLSVFPILVYVSFQPKWEPIGFVYIPFSGAQPER